MLRKSFCHKSIFPTSWFHHFFRFSFSSNYLILLESKHRIILVCFCFVSPNEKERKCGYFSNCSNYRSLFNVFMPNYYNHPNNLIDYCRHIYKSNEEEVSFFYRYCELRMITYYRIVVSCSNPNRRRSVRFLTCLWTVKSIFDLPPQGRA